MRLNHVVIARPGGNDTALVFDPVPVEQRKTVNALIQQQCPEIEQVMFVEMGSNLPRGMMAGGEFCGNATRALGYYLLNGKDGCMKLEISGCRSALEVEVRNSAAIAQMPIYPSFEHIVPFSPSQTIVHMEGISYLVLAPGDPQGNAICMLASKEEQKKAARNLLNYPAFSRSPAMGVIVVTEDVRGCAIKPFVYVRAIDTFYFETACGSGSVAVGLAWAWQQGRTLRNFTLRQPSGMNIGVDVWLEGKRFERASISGPVSIRYDGSLWLDDGEEISDRKLAFGN
jgi:diaminopimelate epimerase